MQILFYFIKKKKLFFSNYLIIHFFKTLTNHSIASFNPNPVNAEHLKIYHSLFFISDNPSYSEIFFY